MQLLSIPRLFPDLADGTERVVEGITVISERHVDRPDEEVENIDDRGVGLHL